MKKTTLNMFNGKELSITENDNKLNLTIGDISCELTSSAVKELIEILSEYLQFQTKESMKSKESINERP